MVDGRDVGVPSWENDGDEYRLEIGDSCRHKGDAHGPEGPIDKQAYHSDYHEKPRGLGGTSVITGPAMVLPETHRDGEQVGAVGGRIQASSEPMVAPRIIATPSSRAA